MRIDRLASVISRGVWLMDPRYCQSMMPMAARYLSGHKVSFFDHDDDDEDEVLPTWCISPEGRIIDAVQNDTGNLYQQAPVGSIVVISIQGTIMKDDWCGAPGTETMSRWVKEAVWSDNVAAIVFKINSGGGSVEGTGEFAQTIKWADTIKPNYAFTDGLLASAAYWIASACRKIFASFATVEVGSIGTAIKFLDNRKAMEEYGYKEHYINADPSLDKNQDYYQALDGNYTPIKVQILNPTNDIFLLTVRENRDGRLVETESKEGDKIRIEPLSGKVYLAKSAIENGLIDGICTFEEICDMAMEDSLTPPPATNQKSNKMFGNKFSALSAMAGIAASALTEAHVAAANKQIEAANIAGATLVLDSELESITAQIGASGTASADLINANATIADLQTQLSAANSAKNAAEESITTLTADRDQWKTKAVEFGAKGADEHTKGKKTGTDVIEGTEDDDESEFHSEADAELAKIKASQVKLPSRK